MNTPQERLHHHVTGAMEREEAEPIVELCRYKGAWSYTGKTVESEPLPTEGAARVFLADAPRRAHKRILKEHDRTINDGKFFLHLIVLP